MSFTTTTPTPLTTVFTPPASCSDVITLVEKTTTLTNPQPSGQQRTITTDLVIAWNGGYQTRGDPACFPAGFLTGFEHGGYYSPGICPYGWTGLSQNTIEEVETGVVCCPKYVWSLQPKLSSDFFWSYVGEKYS